MEIVIGIWGCINIIVIICGLFWVLYEEWESENRYIMRMHELDHEGEVYERWLRTLHELGPEIEIEERMKNIEGMNQTDDKIKLKK